MILYLTDSAPDYGADLLYHGLATVHGVEHVWDYGVKPSLHLAPETAPTFDCDQYWPKHPHAYDEIGDTLMAGACELFVVPTLRGGMPGRLRAMRTQGLLEKVRDVTMCYDAEDHALDTSTIYADALGYQPAAYFKRELPLGATWARPLPFGYPEERIVEPGSERAGFIYNAYLWNWTKGGLREQIAQGLEAACGMGVWKTGAEPRGTFLRGGVRCADKPEQRMSVADNHRRNQTALVAISPAGQGWGTNRHLEIIADGCAPILQRPTVEFPDALEHGTECLYFDGVDDCLVSVRDLLSIPDRAYSMARAAQAKLRSHHTTAVRARTVWGAVHNG